MINWILKKLRSLLSLVRPKAGGGKGEEGSKR
jgi:hypothetical protein